MPVIGLLKVELLDWPWRGVKYCRNHPSRDAEYRVSVRQRNGHTRRIGYYCTGCGELYAKHGTRRHWPA